MEVDPREAGQGRGPGARRKLEENFLKVASLSIFKFSPAF